MIDKELLVKVINKAIAYGIPFFAYRLPDDGLSLCFGAQTSDSGDTASCGFKIEPFDCRKSRFSRIICPQLSAGEFIRWKPQESPPSSRYPATAFQTTGKSQYFRSIGQCLDLLRSEKLDKIVLSKIIAFDFEDTNWGQFFSDLEAKYPSAFVFIYYTPETGGWAGATPETLGRYSDGKFHTMALAGTRKTGSGYDWTEKEIREQEFVADYISATFSGLGIPFDVSEKATHSAGCVEHLCNYFTADIADSAMAEKLVAALHPTPAVSGIPQRKAMDAIAAIESHERHCYGGYIGPFSPGRFDYFVNLRSLYFNGNTQTLFCGGGITADSKAGSEWEETEAKSATLAPVLKKAGGNC